jgi:hypothetical protein
MIQRLHIILKSVRFIDNFLSMKTMESICEEENALYKIGIDNGSGEDQ